MPNTNDAIIRRVRDALENDPRINLHRHPIRIELVGNAVVLEGEVADIAVKKLALEHTGAMEGIKGVVDRLRVIPAEARGDGAIRDSLVGFLQHQPELRTCMLQVLTKGRIKTIHQPDAAPECSIQIAVESW